VARVVGWVGGQGRGGVWALWRFYWRLVLMGMWLGSVRVGMFCFVGRLGLSAESWTVWGWGLWGVIWLSSVFLALAVGGCGWVLRAARPVEGITDAVRWGQALVSG